MGDEFRRQGLGYVLQPTAGTVRITADHLHRSGDGYTAELLVEKLSNGHEGGILALERHNLVSTRAHSTLATTLTKLHEGPDWRKLLQELCVSVLAAERSDLVFESFTTMPEAGSQTYAIEPLIAEGEINLIYAPGDSGKSRLAKLCAMAIHGGFPSVCEMRVRTGHAAYLNWEGDRRSFQRDIASLALGFGVEGPDVKYASGRHSLADHAEQIGRFIAMHDITFLVIDSFEMACGSGKDHESYQDRALRMLEAIHLFGDGLTVVLIDHVSKETQRMARPGTATPFGSAFKLNEVRWAWEMRSASEEAGAALAMSLYNTKHNYAAPNPPLGVRFHFAADGATTVERDDKIPAAAVRANESKQKNWERIWDVLEWAMTVKEIALATGIEAAVVSVELNRHKASFANISKGLPGEGLWERKA